MGRKPRSGALDPQTLARLGADIAAAELDPELAARMRARVLARAAAPHTEVVRAAEGDWKALLPGVTIKVLHVDREQGTQTTLWRLAAGARIPPHPHSRDEECLVLEGAVEHDGSRYGQGDYLYTRPGVRHADFLAPEGALLLIRSELLPNALLLWAAARLPGR